ncbi:Elongation factor Ts, mitochondrial [Geranomyces variabilis]|uniref:Elongation factor Ts, mitochondrial n=1 Tax=Geranomyces variabilis TaxID=109894 RepID=A0AAD5XQ66_9FUNG|nr:Elongation factor Ts, mitochondrial [Geranomyces variabilis]
MLAVRRLASAANPRSLSLLRNRLPSPAVAAAVSSCTTHRRQPFSSSSASLAASSATRLVAALRKETQCSISKAREAVAATPSLSLADALAWLERDLAASGAKKAAKLGDRVAAEGLVHAVCLPGGAGAAIVEVNAETDFVARSSEFVELVGRVGNTALVLGEGSSEATNGSTPKPAIVEVPLEFLKSAPRLPSLSTASSPASSPAARSTTAEPDFKTVQEDVVETIGKLGENIRIRRAAVVTGLSDAAGDAAASPSSFAGAYAHSGGDSTIPRGFGRIAAIAVLSASAPTTSDVQREALRALANKLAQHVVGFGPVVVADADLDAVGVAGRAEPLDGETDTQRRDRLVLLRQPFVFGGGSVEEVLAKTAGELFTGAGDNAKLAVAQFVRWECGDGIEKKEDNFADEVKKQAGL